MEKADLPKWTPEVSKDYQNGFEDGRRYAEINMFKANTYKLISKDINPEQCSEIEFEGYGTDPIIFEPVRKGYWEPPDNDGSPIIVAICSECQKPTKLPAPRYCPNCGSWNIY